MSRTPAPAGTVHAVRVTCTGAVLVFTLVNCAPSVRYTRTGGQARVSPKSYVVPGNWDYRKDYKVPPSRLASVISSYIGIPYRWGGMSRQGVDCSGFVCMVYLEVNRAQLPHSTRKLRKQGKSIPLRQARAGDLVFFRTGWARGVNHVGIFLGDGRFAHASSSKGVIYSNLNENYYNERFVEVRRIF